MKSVKEKSLLEEYSTEEHKKEVKINDFLSLKYGDDGVQFQVGERNFGTPVHSVLEILLMMCPNNNMSMDEIVEELDNIIGIHGRDDTNFDPEVVFYFHYLYLKLWADSEYNAELIHRYDAFQLLESLYYAKDPIARKVFRGEIVKRFLSGKVYVVNFLFPHYASWLSCEDIKYIIEKAEFLYNQKDYRVMVSNFTENLYENSYSYYENGNFEKAVEILNYTLTLSPIFRDALILLGKSYFELKKYDNAIETLTKIVDIESSQDLDDIFKKSYDFDKSYALRYIAESYLAKGELNKAMDTCNTILELNHETSNPYDIISEIYSKQGNPEEAKKALKLYKKKGRKWKLIHR